MFHFPADELKTELSEVIRQTTDAATFSWLKEKVSGEFPSAQFNALFVSIPRKTGKSIIRLTDEQELRILSIRPGFSIRGWSADRVARVWLLLNFGPADKEKYFRTLENLFLAAEVNELVALYSALPLLAYPEIWRMRCAEGIRNNIADVLQAIMCNNPYPAEQLNEAAWNQMVLKAFFTEKPINEIVGIDERANEKLAKTLTDYAHERWAAHRPVNPQLWRCVGKFIAEENFGDIKKITASENSLEREAAALACHDSNYAPAKELLNNNKTTRSAIESGVLTWDSLAEKIKDYVLQS